MQGARIGVEKQLVGIEAVTEFGSVAAMGSQTIKGARRQTRQIAVPDRTGPFRQCQPSSLPRAILGKQTEFDLRRILRKHCDVAPISVPGDAEVVRMSLLQDEFSGHYYFPTSTSAA